MEPRRAARHHKYETDASLPSGLRSFQTGSWRVVYLDKRANWAKPTFDLLTGSNVMAKFNVGLDSIREASIARYFKDVYFAAPGLIGVYLATNAVTSLQPALELQALDRLFNVIEAVFRGGRKGAYKDIICAIIFRLFVTNTGALCSWLSTHFTPLLDERMSSSFKSRLIEAHLSLDVIAAQDKSNTFSNFSPRISSMALHGFVWLAASLVSSLSQVSVTAHLLRKQRYNDRASVSSETSVLLA